MKKNHAANKKNDVYSKSTAIALTRITEVGSVYKILSGACSPGMIGTKFIVALMKVTFPCGLRK